MTRYDFIVYNELYDLEPPMRVGELLKLNAARLC